MKALKQKKRVAQVVVRYMRDVDPISNIVHNHRYLYIEAQLFFAHVQSELPNIFDETDMESAW